MVPIKKKSQVVIAPSILSADFSKLGNQVRETVRAGCSWIHLDIMDNHFVPNLTFGPPVVKCLRKSSAKAYFDAHLMAYNPASMIEAFAKAGVQSLTVHQEACLDDLDNVINTIHRNGMLSGVSIKPATPVESISHVLAKIDLVLVMTVEPGFGGQDLIPACLSKIREVARLREKLHYKYKIQADGGINEKTAGLVSAAGADVLVAGSAIYNKEPIAENVKTLMNSLK